MSIRVVIDCNVIISAYLAPAGAPAAVIAAWRAGLFTLLVSEAMLAEYRDVLGRPHIRPRHGLSDEQIEQNIADFRIAAELVNTTVGTFPDGSRDPDDDIVLACAAAGHADYIISGDHDLLALRQFRRIPILRPAEFLSL